jgi:hypothetical protein
MALPGFLLNGERNRRALFGSPQHLVERAEGKIASLRTLRRALLAWLDRRKPRAHRFFPACLLVSGK